MNVISMRKTIGGEPGTHLVDIRIYKGLSDVVTGVLFLEKTTAVTNDSASEGFEAEVVGGCNTGVDLHSLGDNVSVRRAEGGPWVLRTKER